VTRVRLTPERLPVLTPERERLAWLAIAGVTIGLGLGAFLLLHPWTRDFLDWRRVLEAGATWRSGGDPYALSGYFYTPALAVAASPLGDWSIPVLVAGELAVLVWLSPRHPIAVLAMLAWPPVWGDITLGNETILLVGALAVAVRGDSLARGGLLGVGLALVPKPMFVPVLLWLLVHRRRSLAGVVLAGAAVTLPAAVATGLYPAFLHALLRGIDPAFAGNIGITTIVPWAGPVVSLAAIAVTLLAVRRDEAGLLVAGLAGTFMGTYVGLYAPVLPAGLLDGYRRARPGRSIAVGVAGSVAWLALPVAALVALGTVLLERPARPEGPDPRY
jgi:hypothetical protein